MRLSHLSVALALAITTSGAAQAQQFSKIVSFGDSLTDAGNVGTISGLPAGSSFTTNPDGTYSQNLSVLLGIGAQSNNSPLIPGTSGNSNYAYGGACAISNGSATAVSGLIGTFVCGNSPGNFSLSTQIGTHLAANGGVADPNALYTYWAGANDLLTGAGLSTLYSNPLIAQAYATQAGQTAIGQIAALQAAGANTIVVFNLPDLGKTPANLVSPSQSAGASALATIYNLNFNGGLATLQDGIVAIDTYAIINEVLANPAAFGFTNTTGVACPASSLACGPAASGYPTQPISSTYLFADGIHPGGRAHALLGNIVYATISAPGVVSLAPEVAMQSAFAHNTAISDALDSEWAAGSEVGKVRGFTSVQFGQQNIDGSDFTPALDADSTSLNVGATYRMSENATFGVAATIGNSSANAGSLGSFDGSGILFGVFGQYEVNGLYGRIGLSGGSTDMDITRNIDLLSSVRKETGSTAISQQSGTLEVGYVFKGDSFTHGPFAGLETTQSDVEGYVEGSSSTAMRFDSFSRDSNLTSVGYQFSGAFDSFKPFARVAWVNESNTDQVFVRGGTANLPANFSLPGFAPGDDSYLDWNVGASMSFGEGFDGYISYRARTGNDVQDNDSISIGIRKTF
ncbi:autotransporter domain-containing protein [Arenimonas sp.]|jgi:outer membrane lipase/esterase|uniref:autotransporter domain-containing protein n=1 Tax=Arenimonas sp. TaxID=1872635 RepID=UPI0037BEF2C8